ncbi:site-specific integrase [Lysinibacillus fusiformis]|uniref:site-specific integrase n=1 Tax=Lysinibacillus TaxID=400634 RepID=UPI0019686671|nr:site-specific integrase [Lysinibacillus fusiformis]QSB10117.1 site-specific integrase [Lysinibacillus fusiformis]
MLRNDKKNENLDIIYISNKLIEEQKEIFESLESAEKIINSEFENDVWVCPVGHLYMGYYLNFDFSLTEDISVGKIKNEILKYKMKFWVCDLLVNLSLSEAITIFRNFKQALYMTDGFKENKVRAYIKYIEFSGITSGAKWKKIHSTLSFLVFSNLNIDHEIVKLLSNYKKRIRIKASIRKLPPSKYLLMFKFYLDKFFEEESVKNQQHSTITKSYILFYPILIWWNLTSIIPVRPSEFCSLSRDCLKQTDEKYFIKINRIKHRENKVQNHQEISISKDLYELINNYIQITNQFGNTKTLISYWSIIWADPIYFRKKKSYKEYFNLHNLRNLINRFYNEIINTRYEDNIENENRVRPNDTRHLSFISLMLQGVSPVEIARLGGHSTIESQYHYSSHVEYWIDSEVFKLVNNLNYSLQNQETYEITPSLIKNKVTTTKKEDWDNLSVPGYCIDVNKRCQTENCMLCDYWRIPINELEDNSNIFEEISKDKKEKIHEIVFFIMELHRQILSEGSFEMNPWIKNKLKTYSGTLIKEINHLAQINSIILKGIEPSDNEKR